MPQQIDQDTLAERIRQLECLTAEKDVNIAVGVIWQDRADTHLDELLQEAEKLHVMRISRIL